jgi:hypothetical protein
MLRPAGAFPQTEEGWEDYKAQFEKHDFSSDEIYGNRPPTWDGDNGDEPEEDWTSGDDFGEEE